MKEWVEISELRDLLDKILTLRNINNDYKEFIYEDFIQAELEERKTHGVGKVLLMDDALKRKKESIINEILEAELSGKEKLDLRECFY